MHCMKNPTPNPTPIGPQKCRSVRGIARNNTLPLDYRRRRVDTIQLLYILQGRRYEIRSVFKRRINYIILSPLVIAAERFSKHVSPGSAGVTRTTHN